MQIDTIHDTREKLITAHLAPAARPMLRTDRPITRRASSGSVGLVRTDP
jgi:hypothetical protein